MATSARWDATHGVLNTERLGNRHGARSSWLRRGLLLAGAIAGVMLGGVPALAARRILYPVRPEPLPLPGQGALDIDVPVHPEWVEFDARDGKKLSGWFVPGPDSVPAPWPCVLLLYGYGGYKEQMAGYAKMVHEGGFAALMFDMCGSGRRLKEPISLGYKERWDFMDAARYARTRRDVDPERLGALGVSMGAVTALLAAVEDRGIKAIVADSAFADLNEMVEPGIKAFLGLPPFPFAPLIVRYAETMLGMKTGEIVPERAVTKLGNLPLFIIHGEDDALVDVEAAHKLYAAARGPKELWIVPGCQHAQAPVVAGDEYRVRVNGFFERWLVPAGDGRRTTNDE